MFGMRNSNILLTILIFSLFFVSMVSSLEVKKTEFVVTTNPYVNLSFTVIDSESKEELQTFEGRARKFGEYKFTYYGLINKVSLIGNIIDNETQEIILKKEFGPYTLGTPQISFNLTLSEPEQISEILNESNQNSEVSVTNKSATGKSPIIGFVTGSVGEFSNIYYYVGAGALGLIILIIVFKKRFTTMKSAPVEPNPKKTKVIKKMPSKVEVAVPKSATVSSTSVDETEKKIIDLQKQLEQIRSEEKLVKLQKQLDQERQELNKLRSENNLNNQKI